MTTPPAPFGRMLTAMVTPFTADGDLDLDTAAALAVHLVEQGNDGLVVNGTTGEAPTTSRQEKADLLRVVVDAVGDRASVVAGVGTYDTAATVELSEDAGKAGATGLLSVTPYYSRTSDAGLLAHYARTLEATDLPVMLYDIPVRTGLALSHEVLLRLADHPRVVAVKDAKDDVGATSRLLAETDLAVYSGIEELTLPLLALGGVGVVSVAGHVATPQIVSVMDAYARGDVVAARRTNLALQPVYRGLFRAPGVVLAKAALALVGRPAGPVRLPLVEATEAQVAALRDDLAGLLEGAPAVSHPHPHLGPPPPLPAGGLRVVALGGLAEIGRNMTVFEHAGRLLVVDCGVLFPEEEQPGIDLILPDFSYIRDRLHLVEALVITHGHEDHLGAVPYLLRERRDLPVIGSRFTLALLEAKLREHRITPVLREVREEQVVQVGPFGLEFFAVNHSIPDALAVAIRTQAGLVLHTGDFKMDQLPLDGRLTDLGGFARLGREGVDLLLSDSTNAEVPGFVTPEREIGPVVDDVVRTSEGRVIVACFASHVHRVQQVLDAADRHGRHVAFVGRSMVRNMGVARDLGLLHVAPGLMVDMKDVESLPDRRVVLVSTGSQGEPLSALSRMANRSHHQIRIEPQDTVVLASSLIPGNENAVYRVINGLSRWGARVVHKGVAKVHVSGHAPAGELLYLLNAVRPSNLMPVHGEWRHLRAHARLGRLTGVPEERIVLAEDGVVVDLVDGKAEIVGAVPCGYVYVDGLEVGDVSETTLKDRRILGDEGFISVTVAIDAVTGKVAGNLQIAARGFSDDPRAFDPVRALVEAELEGAARDGVSDVHAVAQAVRRVVGRWVSDTYRRRPMIIPVVIEV